jgi:hypothetical protein
MASPTSIVHVEKPPEILLGEYFVEMRIWLDAHQITPATSISLAAPALVWKSALAGPSKPIFFAGSSAQKFSRPPLFHSSSQLVVSES